MDEYSCGCQNEVNVNDVHVKREYCVRSCVRSCVRICLFVCVCGLPTCQPSCKLCQRRQTTATTQATLTRTISHGIITIHALHYLWPHREKVICSLLACRCDLIAALICIASHTLMLFAAVGIPVCSACCALMCAVRLFVCFDDCI